MSEKAPPIEPQEFRGGVTVVDIGDIRVARGLSRRPRSSCAHKRVHYDQGERRIWCADCESDVEPFDAFTMLVSQYDGALKKLRDDQDQVSAAKAFQARSLAARTLDKAWRSRTMLPACPSCRSALFPEDFKDGAPAMISREYAEAARRKAKP